MDLDLAGRRALVTGGSRGIGKATAAALLAEGAEVAIAARDRVRLDEAAADLGAAAGREVAAFAVDTGDDASVRQLVVAGWGRIISVSGLAALSTGSVIGSIRNVAVSAMTKNLADELGPSGVNVNAVHPGLTRTEATPGVVAAQADAAGVAPAEIERRMARRNLTRTLIDASQVAAVIAFLASPLAVSVNGESIACGGGTPGVIRY
jgi:NAD(P)-dependent dehydrogenase (short-subunit alcohol dehydrogenase family)